MQIKKKFPNHPNRNYTISWGARCDKNTNRPYFVGHEREDVVLKRKEFVDFFSQTFIPLCV
jgi:hypothetical protein